MFKHFRHAIHMFASATKDFLVLRGFWRVRSTIDYAFLVHPRDVADVHAKYPFLRHVGEGATLWLMKHFWPVRVAPIHGLLSNKGEELHGWVLACPYTATQLMEDRELARRAILATARLARKFGAKVIGLGALTASLSRGGLDVSEHIKDVTVVTGRFYTVVNICGLVHKSVEALGLDSSKVRVAVVGVAGSIGAGVAQLLVRQGICHIQIIDIVDKFDEVKRVQGYIKDINPQVDVQVYSKLMTPLQADIVVTATNRPDALIERKHLLPGTVVVDDAQPSDVADELFEDPSYLILEGGVVHAPSMYIPFALGLQQKGDIFSCLGELLLIMQGDISIASPLGRELHLNFQLVDALTNAAHAMQFTPGDFQNQYKLYNEADVARVRSIRATRT
ncbi:MAG: hypothetical protein KBD24_00710 [Candidatus Pacebacteria bacterium]|nr:hypothetical protein [Candidatus Paceibacterota bacterium]